MKCWHSACTWLIFSAIVRTGAHAIIIHISAFPPMFILSSCFLCFIHILQVTISLHHLLFLGPGLQPGHCHSSISNTRQPRKLLKSNVCYFFPWMTPSPCLIFFEAVDNHEPLSSSNSHCPEVLFFLLLLFPSLITCRTVYGYSTTFNSQCSPQSNSI